MPGADFPTRYEILVESPMGNLDGTGSMRKRYSTDWRYMRVLGKYALVLLCDGEGFYEDLQNGRMEVSRGAVLMLYPDLAHRYGPEREQLWDEVWILFSGPVFDLWRRRGLLDPSRPVLQVADPAAWRQRLAAILDGVDPARPGYELRAICEFQALLAELVAVGTPGETEPAPPWMGEAFRLLGQDPTMGVDVPAVARQLGMSYETFRKKFRAYTGKSPGRYVSQIVANRACELLYAGHMSVKEVAAELGYCNEFHFSRRFKEITGQSPSRFAGRVTASAADGPDTAP